MTSSGSEDASRRHKKHRGHGKEKHKKHKKRKHEHRGDDGQADSTARMHLGVGLTDIATPYCACYVPWSRDKDHHREDAHVFPCPTTPLVRLSQ
eukprot:30658-Eustigmatos_ZCMA.PRE.1